MLARSLLAATTLTAATIGGAACGGGSDPELNVPEWHEGAEATIAALESRGVETRFDIAPGQRHVMALQMPQVMDEIDLMLGR